HDGNAEAPMFEFHGDLRELAVLERNVSAAPYVIATRPHVLVIGLGGGFDVLNGLRNGAAEITGVELDPVTVDVVRHHQADFNGGILARADVRAVVAEGRSFLQHSGGRYDVIQLTGVDTLAALSTGAYMLTADAEGRAQLLRAYPLNIAATWDDRPFFFHFYRWKDLLRPAAWEVDTGHTLATGQLVLGAILIVAVITSIAFIVGPLLSTPALRRPGLAPFVLYFAAIGVGFMLIEISLIQHFILFLGHPTYSVAVILFALLV